MNKNTINNVLMLVPSVFNYDKILEKSLSKFCENYICLNERPNNSFFIKAGLRLNFRPLSLILTYQYFNKILFLIKEKSISTVLIINPEATPLWFIKKLRLKKINIIFYLWDSIKNKPKNKELISHSSKIWSFDRIDCKKYNLLYKPLFYSKKESNNSKENKYDISFIGTLHGDRYDLVNNIFNLLQDKRTFKFFYCPSKLLFYYNKYVSKKWAHIKRSDVSFTSLKYEKVKSIIDHSSVILDIHSPSQNGLTMRTIETLGCGKKILTTNSNIKNELFYSKYYVMCFDRKNIKNLNLSELNNFILSDKIENINIQSQYIDIWLKNLFLDSLS